MEQKEIIYKIANDVNYIPTLEEYKLVKDLSISYGLSPIFSIRLQDSRDITKINAIEEKTHENRPSGIYELYCQLEVNGYCESYKESRIYYVAYTLAENKILFNIEGTDYRDKQNKKIQCIEILNKQLLK